MTVHGLHSDIYGFQNMHTNVVTFSLIRAICPFPDPTIAAGSTYTFNIICNAVYNIIPHLNIQFTTSYFIYSYIFKNGIYMYFKIVAGRNSGPGPFIIIVLIFAHMCVDMSGHRPSRWSRDTRYSNHRSLDHKIW